MFSSENVEVYLMDTYPDVDGDKRLIKMRCYINPVSRELCQEVDEELARTLFHLVGSEWIPRPTLQAAKFNLGTLPPYALNFCRDPRHSEKHTHIPAVKISKVEAGKVTPESSDFALMFTVEFEKHDPKWMNDLADLYHEKFFCSFVELQPNLFANQDPAMQLACRLCGMESPEFATTDGKFAYCSKCAPNTQEGEQLRRIRDHAAAQAVVNELHPVDEPGRAPGQENGPPREDPLAAEGDFINKRNSKKRRAK